MKDKIYQQIGFARCKADEAETELEKKEWVAYIQGLRYCLGLFADFSDEPKPLFDSFKDVKFTDAVKRGELP